jgi:hypothetical protein
MDIVYTQLSRYTQPAIIILGIIGALLNQILFFSRKKLRSSSCSLYFRALSLNDLSVLLIVILPQWLEDQFAINSETKSNWYCKLSVYLTYTLYALSPYFIVLACFDRLCTSSKNVRFRKLATIRVASYLIPCMTIIVFAAYCHVPILYQLISISTNSYCTVLDSDYYFKFAAFLLIFACLIPPLLMVIFCGMTMIHLRQQRRRIMPVNQTRSRQRDIQILKMLFIYVTSNIIFTVPFSLTFFLHIYYLRTASLSILIQLFTLLLNINYATSFYLYTLATPFYRNELFSLMKSIWQRIHRRYILNINQRA